MTAFKKLLSLFLRIGISVIVLVLLLRQVDKRSLWDIVQHADKCILGLAFSGFFFGYLLALYRWEMLLKTVGIRLPFKRVAVSFCGGVFFNVFLPSTIGGDLVRSIDLSAYTKRPKEVVATVILDRLSGYVGLVFIALIALLFAGKLVLDKVVLLSVAIITGLLIIMLLVLFNNFIFLKVNRFLQASKAGGIREMLSNLHQEIYIFRQHRSAILVNLLLSVLIQVITPLSFYITALSFGLKVNMLYFFIFLPIISAITLLPISIGGLGIREYSTKLFFAKVGVSAHSAFAIALLNSIFILIYAAIGGVIYVIAVKHKHMRASTPG